jgi:hypothetical protein
MYLIMKYLTKSQIIPGLFLLISLLSSCTKDFEKMNQNPNNPVDVPAINIFTNAEQSSISRQMGDWIQHTYLGVWCQQWCKVQYIDEDRYMPRDMSTYFNSPYTFELKNLSIVIEKAAQENEPSLAAAATIMRAWVFMYLTDIWGDVPYSEALQGFIAEGTLTPKYDTQESIYADLNAQLEAANTALTGTNINFGSGDIIYGGDPTLWRKLGNSLRLRLLNRAAGTPWSFTYDMAGGTQVTTTPGPAALSNADAMIGTMLSNPETYPVFESNDDNALLYYPGLPYRNPIFNALYTRTDQAISETMVNWLKARNDPRLIVYAQPTPNSVDAGGPVEYVGFQNGRGITSAPFPEVSLLGTKIAYTETAPLYLLTYDEVEFIKAEYYMRTNADADAQDAYEAGIAGSMERWGLADGGTVKPTWGDGKVGITTGTDVYNVDYAAYLAEPLVAWGGTDAEKFQKICEQRWAAIYGEGVQAYSEVRRTGFPARIFEYELEGAYYPNLGLPIRLQYALSEETYNADNLAASELAQNIESINEGMFSTNGTTSQVWWNTRKNPIPTVTDVLTK